MGTLALLFLFFSLLSGLALGQSAELLNQAKKEGEVILYTTMLVFKVA